MSALLAAENLELAYGELAVCRGISIEVNEGEIVALIGANGAGKSTTLRAIAGLLTPRSGAITFRGQDITRLASHERALAGIALVPEGRHVFPFLTARENLELGGFKNRRDSAKVRRMIDGIFEMFPRLKERDGQNAGTLSGGEQQMLVLGRAMMSEPKLLCLDEPSLGLAPLVVRDIFRTIRTINECRNQRAAGRAERALRAGDREPRLCVADRQHHGERKLRRAREGHARTRGVFGTRGARGGDMSDPYSLAAKNAVVTGAGSGIGRAIALAFADAGAQVACVDLDAASAKATAAEAAKSGRSAIAVACDVGIESDVTAAAEKILAAFPAVHVLVNGAAGYDPNGTVLDLTLADWNRVMAVNVGGAFLMSRALLPAMIAAGGGSIIHIASQLGSVAAARRAVYCTSKGALIQLARAMATDHAGQNVRVNTLSPGAVETERLVKRFGDMETARRISGPKHLLGRLGQPDEIATAAVFLASDASRFMTGADLLVDGGYNAT